MSLGTVLDRGPVQIAYGVSDVEQAAAQWARRWGAGPFFVRHHIDVDNAIFNAAVIDGVAGSFDHSSAYGQWGELMVELVAVHDPPSLATIGLHHLAYFVDDFETAAAALTADGCPSVMTATAGSTRFAFHDGRADLGHLIEIYESAPPLQRFYAMVAEAASGWQGDDPVRVLS